MKPVQMSFELEYAFAWSLLYCEAPSFDSSQRTALMGITIKSVHRMDGYGDQHFGTVVHNGYPLDAVLVGPIECLQPLINTDVTAEYELNEIISIDAGLDKDDSMSGIYPLPGNQIAVDGSIHFETKIDEAVSLLDIYIQNGADFLTVSTEELGQKPPIGTRIRITGKGLHVYPTFA